MRLGVLPAAAALVGLRYAPAIILVVGITDLVSAALTMWGLAAEQNAAHTATTPRWTAFCSRGNEPAVEPRAVRSNRSKAVVEPHPMHRIHLAPGHGAYTSGFPYEQRPMARDLANPAA
jgi:hypothetical protein